MKILMRAVLNVQAGRIQTADRTFPTPALDASMDHKALHLSCCVHNKNSYKYHMGFRKKISRGGKIETLFILSGFIVN